jgi:hypothetical protein
MTAAVESSRDFMKTLDSVVQNPKFDAELGLEEATDRYKPEDIARATTWALKQTIEVIPDGLGGYYAAVTGLPSLNAHGATTDFCWDNAYDALVKAYLMATGVEPLARTNGKLYPPEYLEARDLDKVYLPGSLFPDPPAEAQSVKDISLYPHVAVVGRLAKGCFTAEEILDEVPMFSASPAFVQERGGPISKEILARIPQKFFDDVSRLGLYPHVDIRLLTLRQGDFPAYPGWHCDGEFRQNYESQPDLFVVPRHRHIVCTVSSDPEGVSNTEFVTLPFRARVIDPTSKNTLWRQVHDQVERNLAADCRTRGRDGDLVSFDGFTLHRATPARVDGVRLFLRVSMWHKPHLGNGGLLSSQELVFRESPLRVPGLDSVTGAALKVPRECIGLAANYTISEIAGERNIRNADIQFLKDHGGPLCAKFVDAIPKDFIERAKSTGKELRADLQVVRLYPQNVPFSVEHSNVKQGTEIFVVHASSRNGGVCSFVEYNSKGAPVALTRDGCGLTIPSGHTYGLTPAQGRGWFVALVAKMVDPKVPPDNRFEQQLTVYVPSEETGW